MTFPLSGLGLWSSALRFGDPATSAEVAPELEELGYSALWIPDVGGDVFESIENLLAATSTIVVATGILNLWMHDPDAVAAATRRLVDAYGSRVLIGIGVSHAPLIDATEPDTYRRPLNRMREYLDALDVADPPLPQADRVLAALGPKMLDLARTRSGGVHPYLVTPQHTALARAAMGPDRLVAPEQAVVLEEDPVRARELARHHLAAYLDLPNYANNLIRLGFVEDDLRDGGSDRLVDGLIAWGDDDAIRSRVEEHRDAGADHVCVQVLTGDFVAHPVAEWRRLAAILFR
jgi:probable F420-dependent oxidoreductase